ncbi:hypothetical protein A7K50_12445 [Dehalobacter sp. MCB1]|uniref:hypothetical protein n=1 Tax=Dehalobacter sp. MCB1 TaxID=1844756 RepID=UPI000E6BF4EA|nr:hypothetical protein [Dehalobacter sp. MCB1]RJE46827.1 hypothetical protein A7K50_12445 [Dehalobacter sp. MCB1]
MSKLATASINSFASTETRTDFVPPSEEAAFILSASQLSALISQAVEKAIQPLVDRIEALEATVAQQNEKITASEKWQNTLADNQGIQLQLINTLRRDAPTKAPASHETKPTKKTSDHIDEIALILANREKGLVQSAAPKHYLTKLRKEGMKFSDLAAIMNLTVDRIRQLSRIAATDQRFNVTWHPRKKNAKIIKLRRWDAPGL